MDDSQATAHFAAAELRCRCGRPDCNAAPMRAEFLIKLEALRIAWGRSLMPTSAARCPYWNAHIGGAPESQHLVGNATDFVFAKTADARAFAQVAEKCGMTGIGTGIHLVHVDNRPAPARWTYTDR